MVDVIMQEGRSYENVHSDHVHSARHPFRSLQPLNSDA